MEDFLPHGLYSASYCDKLVGVKARITRARCEVRGYKTAADGRIVELYDVDDVRAVKRELIAEKRREAESRRMMEKQGRQLCRTCGAIIPFPGTPYCNDNECLPPSRRKA